MFRISVTSQNYTAWTCKKKPNQTNQNEERPGFIHRKGKQFTKKKVSLMSHFKIIIIIIIKKKRLSSNSFCCTTGTRWMFVHWGAAVPSWGMAGVLGNPPPKSQLWVPCYVSQPNTNISHSLWSPHVAQVSVGDSPTSPSSALPRSELHNSCSVNIGVGGVSGCSNPPRKGSLAFGQLWNETRVLWRRKWQSAFGQWAAICDCSSLSHTGSISQVDNGAKFHQYRPNSCTTWILSCTRVIWVPSNHDAAVEASCLPLVWPPSREKAQNQYLGAALKVLNPIIKDVL